MAIVKRPVTGTGNELDLFDERPIKLEGFVLRARTADPIGKPTIEAWTAAFTFACGAQQASPFWIGDLLNYAEAREDWRERVDQAVAQGAKRYADQTLHNMAYVSRKVQGPARTLAPSLGHASEVANLGPVEQVEWLDKAATEGMTQRDLRLNIRAAKRRRVIEGQAVLAGMFRIIYADPPWVYGDRPPSGVGQGEHYHGMSIEDICKLPVRAHTLEDSALFMWVTAPLALANPGPREVGEAWGYTYKQQIVWDKVEGNYSHYTGGNHEVLTIWTRGSCLPDLPTELPDSVQVHRKSRTHSEKPEEFRRLIEKHWTRGPYLELFGREQYEGWVVWGDDAALWPAQTEAAR